jgi:hypothetical protein
VKSDFQNRKFLSLDATLEIRLGTRQLPTQMPRQVTIFRSLPRQKNAEAIPPLFLKLETTASVFLLKFTNCSVRVQTTVFVFCITSSFELLSSTLGEQRKISFIATLQNI